MEKIISPKVMHFGFMLSPLVKEFKFVQAGSAIGSLFACTGFNIFPYTGQFEFG
jgi:hypothetical protein